MFETLEVIFEMWCFHSRSQDSSTPRYGWCVTTSKAVIPMLYWCIAGDLFWVTCMTKHFEVLIRICQSFSHWHCLSMSSCKMAASLSDLIWRYKIQLSAKRRTFDLTDDGKSLIYIKNKCGPRTVPWGTPDLTSTLDEWEPSKTTLCWRLVRKWCL